MFHLTALAVSQKSVLQCLSQRALRRLGAGLAGRIGRTSETRRKRRATYAAATSGAPHSQLTAAALSRRRLSDSSPQLRHSPMPTRAAAAAAVRPDNTADISGEPVVGLL